MTTDTLVHHPTSPLTSHQLTSAEKLKVLVIDDDPAIGDTVRVSLTSQRHDCEVRTATSGRSGLEAFEEWQPDIVLLDISLPEINGLQVLRRIRERSDARVIILSGARREADIVRGLELGADDYITKPFGFLELMARIRTQARQIESTLNAQTAARSINLAGLTLHFATREVQIADRRVTLTATEYRLLYYLIQNRGRLISYHELLQHVWDWEAYGTDVIRVYVSRLRSKIEPDPEHPRYIATKPGFGYLFTSES
jgi:two-component system KDP operon response regulator KdpE